MTGSTLRRYTDGTRFWELDVVDASLTLRWGSAGSEGETRTRTFRSAMGAMHEYHRRARDLAADGFELDPAPKHSAQRRVVQSRAEISELERNILANVEDDAAFAVYGDWLAERGDARGELIALHARGESKKAAKYLSAHPELWGGLADLVGVVVTDAVWRMGFLDAVSIGNSAKRFDWQTQVSPADVLSQLFDDAGRFVRTLSIGLGRVGQWDAGRRVWYDDELAVLVERAPPTLRQLTIGTLGWEEGHLSEAGIREVASLSGALPRVQKLCLRAGYLDLRGLRLPELRELSVVTDAVAARVLDPIATQSFRSLEKLDLMFVAGRTGVLSDDATTAIDAMLRVPPPASLRSLGLRNFEAHHRVLPRLLASGWAPQLRELDLSFGTLDDTVAALVAQRRSALPALGRLVVTGNLLTDAGLEALRGAGMNVVSEPSRRSATGQRARGDYAALNFSLSARR